MVGTPPPPPPCLHQVVGPRALRQAIKVRIWRAHHGLPWPRDISERHHHGCGQSAGCAGLAVPIVGARSPWVLWTHGLLPVVQQRLWRHRQTPDVASSQDWL
jgi:hypothetical protein